MTVARVERIQQVLAAALTPVTLQVFDDSAQHAGHAGARDGRGHFRVEVCSERFTGMPPIARHRLVYAALGEMMVTDIHALQIRASAPHEREQR